MAGKSNSSSPIDLKKLKALMEMMERYGVTEISLKSGKERLRLRRGQLGGEQTVPLPATPAPVAPPAPAPTTTQPQAAAAPAGGKTDSAGGADDSEQFVFIKSPTVGTFYAAPSPDDPPFVQVGDEVKPDTIVCIVEAMKVFNQIPAEVSGTIVEILVNNGDPVEYGQPLFKVRPK